MVNVYWASLNDSWLLSDEPVDVWRNFYKTGKIKNGIEKCPAFNSHMKNYWGIKSDYKLNFNVDYSNGSVDADDLDTYHQVMWCRNPETKLWSFKNNIVMFTDAPSLYAHLNLPPWLEDNDFAKKTKPIAGGFDIGKWFRPLEYSFFLEEDSMKINYGDIYQYIYLDTDEKVNWIKFAPTEDVLWWIDNVSQERNVHKNKKLPWFYDHLTPKIKKKILAAIKDAVV